MFYSQLILAKKGPYSSIWLAAHSGGTWKLTKAQILTLDISQSVEKVQNPEQPLALRMSGHLLLGVVRIYLHKVKYLYNDSNEAYSRMTMTTRRISRANDLPAPSNTKAGGRVSINVVLPSFDDLDTDAYDLDELQLEHWARLQEEAEDVSFHHMASGNAEITMKSEDLTFDMVDEDIEMGPLTPFKMDDDEEKSFGKNSEKRSREGDGEGQDETSPQDKRSRFSTLSIEQMRDGDADTEARLSLMKTAETLIGEDDFDGPSIQQDAADLTDNAFELEETNDRLEQSLGAMDELEESILNSSPAKKPRKRKNTSTRKQKRRDQRTEFTNQQIRKWKRSSKKMLAVVVPPYKRRGSLWLEDGRQPATTINQLFSQHRILDFNNNIRSVYARFISGEVAKPMFTRPKFKSSGPDVKAADEESEIEDMRDPEQSVADRLSLDNDLSRGSIHDQNQDPDITTFDDNLMEMPSFGDTDAGAVRDAVDDGTLSTLASDDKKETHESKVAEAIAEQLEDAESTTFNKVLGPSANRKIAARAFFQILSLATKGRISVTQDDKRGDILVRASNAGGSTEL